MNDLVKKENTLPSLANFGAALQQQAVAIGNSGPSEALLRLLRDGTWVYGQDNLEVEAGAHLALNPHSLQHGFVQWGDERILGEVMVPMVEPKPAAGSLPEVDGGKGWQDQYSVLLKFISSDDKGTQVMYKGTAQGLKDAFANIVPKIASRASAGETDIAPVIELGVSSYTHKKYGKIYKPVITIVGWVNIDGEATPAPAAIEDDSDHAAAIEQCGVAEAAIEEDGDIEPSAESAAFVEAVVTENAAAPRRRRRAQ